MADAKTFLNLDDLKNYTDLKQEDVYLETLHTWVTITELSAAKTTDLRVKAVDKKGNFDRTKYLKSLVIAAVVNPHFDEVGVEKLFAAPSRFSDELVAAISRLNDTGEAGVKAAEESFLAGE